VLLSRHSVVLEIAAHKIDIYQYTGLAKKAGPPTHDHNSVKSERIKKRKFTGRFLGKFAVKWILKIPPHLAYVATLPCETLMLVK